jgi:integrase
MKTEEKKPKKSQRQRTRYLTLEEEARLLEALAPKYRDVIVFVLDTGARVREALGLQWADLAHHPKLDRVTYWRTKSKRARTVPLSARAQACLVRAKDASIHRPFPMTYSALHKAFNIARQRAGLGRPGEEAIVIHSLRHTFASRLAQNDYPLPKLQLALGHKNLSQTIRYAHLSPAALEDLTEYLERPA